MSIKTKIALWTFGAATMLSAPAIASTIPAAVGISPFGGVVFDGYGLNGQRIVSQTAGADLNKGAVRGDPAVNDFLIGQQGGFGPDLLDQLGGGFASVSIRLTLFDGDNDPGNFDFDDNFLRVNDVIFGNFSEIVTTTTDAQGNVLNGLNDGIGFGDNETDTGTFTLRDDTALAALFASLQQTGTLTFEIDKRDTNGNFFDFTSGRRIPFATTGVSPTLTAVPLPAGIWLLLAALGGLGVMNRRKTI